MTTTLCKPGLRALSPFTPIGHVGGVPVYPLAGARRGGGVEMVVDDRDGDEPDDFDDEGDEDDLRSEFTSALNRRTGTYDEDEDDDDEEDEEEEPRQGPRQRPRRQTRQRTRDEQGDADDDADDADGDDEQGDIDNEADDWTPPTREQVRKMEAQLKRTNTEAWKTRHVRKIMNKLGVTDDAEFSDWLLDRGIDPESGEIMPGARQLVDSDGDQETLTRDQLLVQRRRDEERGAARTAAQYKPAVVQFAVAAALREAEFSGKNMDLAMRLIDQDQIDLEFQEGELVVWGVDDQIKALKTDFPELFKKAPPPPERRREGGRTPAGRRADTSRADNGGRDVSRVDGGGRDVSRTGARSIDGGDRGRRGARRAEGWMEKVNRQISGAR